MSNKKVHSTKKGIRTSTSRPGSARVGHRRPSNQSKKTNSPQCRGRSSDSSDTPSEVDEIMSPKENTMVSPSYGPSYAPTQSTTSAIPSSRRLTSPSVVQKKAAQKIRRSNTVDTLQQLNEVTQTLENTSQEDNEFDYFAKSVSCQLKKLPESRALESMAYIQSYLVKQRMKSNR